MAATDKFLVEKRIAGAMRNDTPPTIADGEPASLRINSDSELIVSIGGGTGAVSTQGDTAHDSADGGNPVKIGGKASASEAAAVDEGDRVNASFTLAGRQRVDSSLTQINGNTALTGGANGSLGTGGLAAHDGAATGNPNRIAGVYRSAAPSVDDGDIVDFWSDSAGRIHSICEGAVADDVAATSSSPVKMGGVVDVVPADTTDGDMVHLITDLQRYLRVVSKSFNSLTSADQVETLNTDGTDYDQTGLTDADESNLAADTYYYPSSNGRAIGTRRHLGWALSLNDITSCELEITVDGGTTWIPITASLIDRGTNLTGYAATHFTSAAGVDTDFYVEIELGTVALTYRWKVVVPNNTETHKIIKVGRAI
jgi:hypothetical protein